MKNLVTPTDRESYAESDPIRIYMREIAEVPLITVQEEIQLAKRIKKGDAAAREHMIRANLRLVVKIARGYENYGLPLLDLISEGNIGLMKAVERFDPKKGAKLSTYSAWWIKQSIKRALADQGKTIRLPVHVVDKLFLIRKCETQLIEILGREPTDFEIAEEISLPLKKIKEYRKASIQPTSLCLPLGGEDDSGVLGDYIPDTAIKTSAQIAEDGSELASMQGCLKILNPRERAILTLRFGLKGDDEKTLEEVGQMYGLTRERIRQIQDEALRRLRKHLGQQKSGVDKILGRKKGDRAILRE